MQLLNIFITYILHLWLWLYSYWIVVIQHSTKVLLYTNIQKKKKRKETPEGSSHPQKSPRLISSFHFHDYCPRESFCYVQHEWRSRSQMNSLSTKSMHSTASWVGFLKQQTYDCILCIWILYWPHNNVNNVQFPYF